MKEENKAWIKGIYRSTLDYIINNSDIFKMDNLRSVHRDDDITLAPDPVMNRFYSCFTHWNVTWTLRDNTDTRLQGSFEFLPIEQVMKDVWDDELGGNSFAPDMKGFRPLDMFFDMDGFVGFFVDREDKHGLYLQHSDSSISPLHVDFDGYLKLLAMSKGYGWWQTALLEISDGYQATEADNFKKDMPALFPDFNYDEFVALYESVRIDK